MNRIDTIQPRIPSFILKSKRERDILCCWSSGTHLTLLPTLHHHNRSPLTRPILSYTHGTLNFPDASVCRNPLKNRQKYERNLIPNFSEQNVRKLSEISCVSFEVVTSFCLFNPKGGLPFNKIVRNRLN